MVNKIHSASFRDPSGFILYHNHVLYRQINYDYKENYDHLMQSGLYTQLSQENLLIPHQEVSLNISSLPSHYKIIQPEKIPFVSYPYEWCFSQLKDAALLTLKVQKIALEFGMILKDSSVYNIQFKDCHPILIDTLSFEKYKNNQLWPGYKQFIQHFLAPLALIKYAGPECTSFFKSFIDGVPLAFASKLLPFSSYFNFSLLTHIHLHAKTQNIFFQKEINSSGQKISKKSLCALIDNLENTVKNLYWKPQATYWDNYYNEQNSYTPEALKNKQQLVNNFLAQTNPENIWDLGANTGIFSQIAQEKGIFTLSLDKNESCIEKNYHQCQNANLKNILPLVVDIANPSPSLGWANQERDSLVKRGPADMVFVLGLMHHLRITDNICFENLAKFFSQICKWLIIEFIPKNDSQVEKMLKDRKDIFDDYYQSQFENVFQRYFELQKCKDITQSLRKIYLFKQKESCE
ncbi:MAG: class I SAM-dependent methyltransferase [Candidatus Omnitrophota bacterium]